MEPTDFQPKLAVFDLDGTLTESKQPLEADMGKVLTRLMEKMPIAIMSGCSYQQFQKQFLPGLPNEAPAGRLFIFPTNASQCYVLHGTEWRQEYNHSLSSDEKSQITEAIHRALAETGFEAQPEHIWGERIEDRDAQIAFSYYGQDAPLEVKRAWDPDRKKRAQIRAALIPLLTDFSISIGGMNTIDITRKGVTKSFGLRALSRITGIDINDMLYVGDALEEGGNDEVVKETGIHTLDVIGPDEVKKLIERLV
jgi:phosphomannomutase